MTFALCAAPEGPTPAMSAASKAPTDAPIAEPTPPITWVAKRTPRVRRWTAAVSSSDHSLVLEDGPNAQRDDQEAQQDHERLHRDALAGPCPDRRRHDT